MLCHSGPLRNRRQNQYRTYPALEFRRHREARTRRYNTTGSESISTGAFPSGAFRSGIGEGGCTGSRVFPTVAEAPALASAKTGGGACDGGSLVGGVDAIAAKVNVPRGYFRGWSRVSIRRRRFA
jgi:hypothetical protein